MSEPRVFPAVDLNPARLPGHRVKLAETAPLKLDCGAELGPVRVAYQTYGRLNAQRSNAILVCHALTGDQFAANTHPVTGKPGWWELTIGSGLPLDTGRYFVVCANVLGGCMGTTGPIDRNPATGEPFGLSFPVITIGDMVRLQAMLLDHLGIESLFCVIGGSMGGMQALQWASSYPERVFSAVPIAASARHSAQNIAFHEVGRQAIMADPDWQGGNYLNTGRRPTRGLSVARMAAHITYLSETALHRKFGRALQDRTGVTYGFDADFQVESYLRHQGISFVDRFDANSYLYITRAMDYFDLAKSYDGVLANAFPGSTSRSSTGCSRGSWTAPRRCAASADRSGSRDADAERSAPRPAPDRRSGRAEYAGARRRLQRRRAARVPGPDQGGRRARHRAQPGRRPRVRHPRARGGAGRRRHRPRDLPRRLVRLRDPEPDRPGDAAPAAGPGEHAADRALRHRVVHQLCPLARPLAPHAARPDAHGALPAGAVVRHIEHPPLHARGFRAAVRRPRGRDPNPHLARRQRRPEPPRAQQGAQQPAERAGAVPVESAVVAVRDLVRF